MKYIMEVKKVSKFFGKNKVLEDVELTMKQGEIVGIIGRNGSGKTVLLKIMAGLYLPTNGEVLLHGNPIDIEKINHKLGILLDCEFLDYETGFNNLKILANLTKEVKIQEIYKVLELVGLDPDNKTKYKNYSTGMKQRLKFAQILLFPAEVLILDEPFNGIDKESVLLFRKIISSLKEEGKSILITSHYQEDIDCLCDRVYEMERGKLKEVL